MAASARDALNALKKSLLLDGTERLKLKVLYAFCLSKKTL
jgi:hypothetical protein